MITPLKIAAILMGLLVLLFVVAWWIGARLPREHSATRTVVFPQTPLAAVWAVIADQAGQPLWRPDLKANVRLPDLSGHPVWRNEMKNGDAFTLEIAEAVPMQKLVTRIVDHGGPFGGTWTYTLAPASPGTRLTITEDGWIDPPLFRVVAFYLIGLHATMDKYLGGLARRLGENKAA